MDQEITESGRRGYDLLSCCQKRICARHPNKNSDGWRAGVVQPSLGSSGFHSVAGTSSDAPWTGSAPTIPTSLIWSERRLRKCEIVFGFWSRHLRQLLQTRAVCARRAGYHRLQRKLRLALTSQICPGTGFLTRPVVVGILRIRNAGNSKMELPINPGRSRN